MNIAWKRLRAYSMILFILPFLCGYVSHAETGVPAGQFNFETKTVLLNSGYEMPILGLGTYSLDRETCVNSVIWMSSFSSKQRAFRSNPTASLARSKNSFARDDFS